jgi:hypothetical protein
METSRNSTQHAARLLLLPTFLALAAIGFAGESAIRPAAAPHPAATTKKTDLSFLKRGITTRQEVQEKLGWADTGIPSDRLFVARWMLSSEGRLRPYKLSEDQAERVYPDKWKSKSVLARFDSNGILLDFAVVDAAHFIRTLGNWLVAMQLPPLDLSHPVEIAMGYPVAYLPLVTDEGRLVLTQEYVELVGTKHNIPGFRALRKALLKVVEDDKFETESGKFNCRLIFNPKLRLKDSPIQFAESALLRFDGQNLLLFVRYLAQTGYPFKLPKPAAAS